MSGQSHEIEVSGLWKVFGGRPERVFDNEHIHKSRAEIQEELGNVVGLRDVSFNVDSGQIFVVMGLSGSGKSTLVRCLIRLIEATRGSIRFDGEDIREYSSGSDCWSSGGPRWRWCSSTMRCCRTGA